MMLTHFFVVGSPAESEGLISCEESAVNSFEDDIVSDPEWNGFKIVGDNIDKTVMYDLTDKQAAFTIFIRMQ